MKFITSNNLTYVLSTLKNKNDALYAPKDHNHEQYLTTNEDGDLVIDGSVIADNIPKIVSEDVLLTISAEVLQNAVDNNIKQLESVAFVANPNKPVYADFAGTTMISTIVGSSYIEFFVADPTMVSGFALTAESGVDFVGDNPEKSVITLRVLNDLEITDLKLYQLEVNTMSSMCLEHDMSVVNSISMGRRGNIGQFSVALGGSCIASGQYSIAGGLASSATGSMSVAFGRGCSSNGTSGLSTGQMCLAGQECFATGRQSKATGRAASVLGNYCVAKGTYSLAEGDNCQANGSTSHAEGFYTIAGSAYQHVQGKYNISDTKSKYAHIVGNGTADDARSNAHTLDWNGNGWFAGNVSIGADNKQLATEEFVNDAINNIEIPEGFSGDYNDLTNRPCYEEQRLLTYTFDGNTDGKITVAGRDSYIEHYVKISDDIDSIQYDSIEVGKVKYVTTYRDGEIKETEAQYINLCEGLDGEIGAISIDSASYIVFEDNFETLMMFYEVTFPEKGIYVAVEDGYEKYYVSSVSLPGSTIKKLDEKFIPDTINCVGGYYWNGQSLDERYAAKSHGTHLTIGKGASNAAAGNHTHDNATISSAGFMSSTDKAKLNLIEITSSQFTYQGSSSTQPNYAFGIGNTFDSESECSGAFGSHNELNGAGDSVAIGDWNTVTASSGIAIGNSCTSSGQYGIAMGNDATTASYAFSVGNGTAADFGSNAMGHFNISYKGNNGGTNGAAFIIGNGTSTSSRSNACRITYAGAVIGKAAYQSSGADYAEYFEWLDGNPNSEDRVGYFVTMDEDKIKIAKEGDYLLGVVSAYPAVIGNNDMEWQGQFLTDEYGRPLKEIKTRFKAGKSVRDTETGIKIATEIEEYEYEYYIVNPEYDPDKKYVHREDRPEWDAIGMMGVLAVHDDGTCEVNGFCKCNNEGIATACERGCDSYRVIKRVNDHIVKIIFK